MTDHPNQLAALILSDPGVADSISELKRQNLNAFEHIDALRNSVRELLLLIRLVSERADISPEVRNALMTSSHVFDAQDLLQ